MCRTKIETSEKSEYDVYVVPVICKKFYLLFYCVVSSLGCKTNVPKTWFRDIENEEEYNQLFDKQWHESFREVHFKGLEYM